MAVLKDMMDQNDLTSVSRISTVPQLANGLTKRGASVASLLSAVTGQRGQEL